MDLRDDQLAVLGEAAMEAVNMFCFQLYEADFRDHLGASVIGDDCSRRIFYGFRWVKKPVISGRMGRLFNRGHQTEARFIEWLKGIGFDVYDKNPQTGKQFQFSAVNGHFGGSFDGVVVGTPRLPPSLRMLNGLALLAEFKTSNSGYFSGLVKNGVAVKNAKHVAQMNTYGGHFGLNYALYCSINKNDDDIHMEVLRLDHRAAGDLVRKAEEIITTDPRHPPRKIAEQPEFFECKNCDFCGVCHAGEPMDKNCRSCLFAQPAANAEWYCNRWKAIIPNDVIPVGCGDYNEIGR